MPKGLPWDKWFFEDLDRDCGALSLAARGAWVWIIGDLRNHEGERSLTIQGWSQVIRATIPQTITVLEEIILTGTCDSDCDQGDVRNALSQKCNAPVTLKCRRLMREAKVRRINALRQQRFRCNADVTLKKRTSNDDVTGERQEARGLDPPFIPPTEKCAEDGSSGGLSPGDLFLILWESYPAHRRGAHQQECLFEFCGLKPDKAFLDRVLAALDVLKASDEWTEKRGKYVPGLLKWIRARGWEVEDPPAGNNGHCKTCSRIGVIVRDGETILPWSLEREVHQGLKPEVCPECRGRNRIDTPGLPDLRF